MATTRTAPPPELHANERVLLAYYIAALKIEAAAAERGLGADYRQYRGIVFGDTFTSSARRGSIPGFDDNSARARTQNTNCPSESSSPTRHGHQGRSQLATTTPTSNTPKSNSAYARPTA